MPPVDQLLRLVPEQARDFAILLLDPDGIIQWWSPGAERIFGTPAAAAIGRHLNSLFTSDDVARGLPELELTIATSDGVAQDDRWLARPDGSRFWATGATVALRGEGQRHVGFVKILRNRTELKEQLEALRRQAEAAEAASRRKDVFLSTLSHELRNPLAPLSHAVQIIRMTATPNPELEPTLKIIERQVESLRRLVDDLLDLTRIGVGKVDLKREPVCVQEVIHQAVESARSILRERRHQLHVLLPPSPIRIEGDASRLEQVFLNLIQNAAKYTPEGGRISVKATEDGRDAIVEVEDNGIGIPHEMLPRIFDLFTQAEFSRTLSQGGLGIGLSLVKDLVTLHGGSVQVRSEGQGMGSTFTVRLPLAPPH